MSNEWRDGIIVSLYKGKGPKTKCSSYRPITLLSVPGKVFAHVLLSRIQPLLESARRPQQSGFTAGRSTVDAVLALRLLSELHREFDRPLHVAYLDIKAAFDSVDRTALWKALCSNGIPDILIQLIEALHQSTGRRSSSDRIQTVRPIPNHVWCQADQTPCCLCQGRFSPMCSFPVYNRYLNLLADHNNLDSLQINCCCYSCPEASV